MDKIDISIVVSNGTFYAEEELLGLKLWQHQRAALSKEGITLYDNLHDIESNIKKIEYIANVYDDMAFLDAEFLLSCVLEMKQKNIAYAKLGDGFIKKAGVDNGVVELVFEGDKTKRVVDESTFSDAYDYFQGAIIQKHLKNGVRILSKSNTHIDASVIIEAGVKLMAATLVGNTYVACDAEITNSTIIDSCIGNGVVVFASKIENSDIGELTKVGPCAYLRGGAKIGKGCRIGDFVEIKNSVLKDGVKCAHLTYVGDAEVGERVNLGCGVVFANYNGKIKQRTIVGKDVFIGSNTNLIAPLVVGDNSYIAAGSTITKDIPAEAFAIARERETVKENYTVV